MPSASMLEMIVMVVCPTFMSHLPDEFLLGSGYSCDRHVRYDLSHFNKVKVALKEKGFFEGVPSKSDRTLLWYTTSYSPSKR